MSKVITFSRTFPAYHPKAGQPTYFVEKIWKSLGDEPVWHTEECPDVLSVCSGKIMNSVEPKHHTIRAGNRWKAGDKFSPRVWSGKPYNSKQIIIAPDIQIKKVWDVILDKGGIFWLDEGIIELDLHKLSANDGLELQDFLDWFPKPERYVELQIICWSDHIEY